MEDQAQAEQAAPHVQARIRTSFERQGLMQHLGARVGHIGPGCVHIVLANRPEVNQQHGYIHAGATSALADSAGGYAAFTLFPEDTAVLTVEYKINFLAPAIGDHIEAVGTVLKSGRTLTVCQARSVRRQGPKAVTRGRRPANAHLRARTSRTVTTSPNHHLFIALFSATRRPEPAVSGRPERSPGAEACLTLALRRQAERGCPAHPLLRVSAPAFERRARLRRAAERRCVLTTCLGRRGRCVQQPRVLQCAHARSFSSLMAVSTLRARS